MKSKSLWLAATALTTVIGPAEAADDVRIGIASSIQGVARAVAPETATETLFVGGDVFQDQVIQTGPDSSIQLIFLDQSTMTIGPNAELTLDSFVFDPAADSGGLSMTLAKGAFRFIGGRITKTSKVEIRTPVATIGVRGGANEGSHDPVTNQTTVAKLYSTDGLPTEVVSNTGQRQVFTQNGVGVSVDGTTGRTSPPAPILNEQVTGSPVTGAMGGTTTVDPGQQTTTTLTTQTTETSETTVGSSGATGDEVRNAVIQGQTDGTLAT